MAELRHARRLRLTADKTTLKSVDGTDDAQLIVTVVDAAGRALSNSPPVTLTIESGPGEFPTGPSITFAQFRHCHPRRRGGDGISFLLFRQNRHSRHVARTCGCDDQINSLGEPKFIAGKTPPVKPRPYVRFTGQPAPVPTTQTNSVFGFQNPTQASSEAPGHNASLATTATPPRSGRRTPPIPMRGGAWTWNAW
jgi:beta-galactosidase